MAKYRFSTLRSACRAGVAGASVVVALASSGTVCAQTTPQAQAANEGDIVVTAQRREQRAQDVGISITAVQADTMRSRGIVDSRDIARIAPGVILDSVATGNQTVNLTIRGISQSDFAPTQESPNSIYLDQIYIASPNAAAFTFYDLDRIEVLRGPQGTLFGRASSGGLVSYISKAPTSTFEGYAQMGYGAYHNAYTEAAFGGPISDRVRYRVAGRAEIADGFWKNHAAGGKPVFEKEFFGVRGQLEADLTDQLTARVMVGYDRNPTHREGTYKEAPFTLDGDGQPIPSTTGDAFGYTDPYKRAWAGDFQSYGYLRNKRFSPSLYLTWKSDAVTISSITNYTRFTFAYREDCDGTPTDICDYTILNGVKQFSQELRANGRSGALEWTVGAYYLHVKQFGETDFSFPVFSGSDFSYANMNPVHQTTESYAIFGQLEYHLTDKLKVTVGARYTHDRRVDDNKVYYTELGGITYPVPDLQFDFSPEAVGGLARLSEGMWSGKVQFDYKPTQDVLLYAGVSRGVKGPGFNANVGGTISIEDTPYKSEYVYAYEAGAKLDLFDRHLRLNGSAFYYDYHRLQGFAFSGVTGVVNNYDGNFSGGEVEATIRLPAEITANIGASYLITHLHDVLSVYSSTRRTMHNSQAPRWTVNGGLNKKFEVGSNTIDIGWSFDYLGDRYASVDNNAATFIKASFVHNANVTLRLADPGIELSGFVRNISNKARQTFAFDLISSFGAVTRAYAPPRTWGVSIRKEF